MAPVPESVDRQPERPVLLMNLLMPGLSVTPELVCAVYLVMMTVPFWATGWWRSISSDFYG